MRISYKLSDVFSDNFTNNHYGVLYAIKNLIDGRYYIGQCNDFINRFRDNPLWSHKINDSYIDNSIRFYKPENFIVIILMENLDQVSLDKYEMIYISRLHTYYNDEYWKTHHGLKQYNQDPGGHGAKKMKAMLDASMNTRRIIGNGDVAYMLHTDEVYEKSKNTRAMIYGSANGNCNTPKARKKAIETNKENHDGHLAWNSPEQVESMMKTQRQNHDGLLAFHTKEAIENRSKSLSSPEVQAKMKETNKQNHGGVLAWHTKDARDKTTAIIIERYGRPCGQFYTEDAIRKKKWNRWISCFKDTLIRMLEVTDEFNVSIYDSMKHRNAPKYTWLLEFINKCNDSEVLELLNKFRVVKLD